jgi:hypothetical protein
MTEETVNLTRRLLTVIFSLLLLGDILLWLMFHASGHRIPIDTDLSFALMMISLIVLLYVIRKHVRPKK